MQSRGVVTICVLWMFFSSQEAAVLCENSKKESVKVCDPTGIYGYNYCNSD